MIIKNLWILSKIGLCYYHYMAPLSDYQIDETLFSGLVAGLSSFADSLSADRKSIDYIKMGEDELYFETVDDVIVATIIAPHEAKHSSFSLKVLLQFIGSKFLDIYFDKLEEWFYGSPTNMAPFTKEIKNLINDQTLLLELKREQFQTLFNDAISGNTPVDLLHWRGVQFFLNSHPEDLEKTMNLILNLKNVVSTLVIDDLLNAKVQDVLDRLSRDLNQRHKQKKLLIICQDDATFDELYKIFLDRGINSIHLVNLELLEEIIKTWKDSTPYDILFIETEVSRKTIRNIYNLEIDSRSKIIMVVNKIPRPPRGRIPQRRPISFIVQENTSDLNRSNPVVEYILNSIDTD